MAASAQRRNGGSPIWRRPFGGMAMSPGTELPPEVVKTILRDRHPIELTAKRLAERTRLPIAWDEQRAMLGTG